MSGKSRMNCFADLGEACQVHAPLAPLTWFKLGGAAEYLIEPRDFEQLAVVLCRAAQEGLPVRFLGLGANVLVRDEGVRGVVIRLSAEPFMQTTYDGRLVTTGAGVHLTKLVNATVRRGLAGLECLAGIPGTVGGGIRMNCGGKFGAIGATVRGARVITAGGVIEARSPADMAFAYRTCRLDGAFVLEATFELSPENPEQLAKRSREIWEFKQRSQPALAEHSAGCIFRNPEGQFAGRLIDLAGLKDTRIGAAFVSPEHANFILAEHGAAAADVISLIRLVQARVREWFGVSLETEVDIWQDDESPEIAGLQRASKQGRLRTLTKRGSAALP